jgi:hypothetical protein
MIYSRFGTQLTLLTKQEGSGRLSIQATAQGTPDIRHYHLGDLTADAGLAEIDAAIATLPWKVVQKKVKRFE